MLVYASATEDIHANTQRYGNFASKSGLASLMLRNEWYKMSIWLDEFPVTTHGNHSLTADGRDTTHCLYTDSSVRTHGWRRGVVVSILRRVNEVTLCRARLVLVFGRVYHQGM